jgi:hypothetical protein
MKKQKSLSQNEIDRLKRELEEQLAHVKRNEENGRFDTVFHDNVKRIEAALLEVETDGTQNE